MGWTSIDTLFKKVVLWLQNSQGHPFTIAPVKANEWSWIFYQMIHSEKEQNPLTQMIHLVIGPEQTTAEGLFDKFCHLTTPFRCLLIPDDEISPYTQILSNESDLLDLFGSLGKIVYLDEPLLIFCTAKSLVKRLPPLQLFQEHTLTLTPSDICDPMTLAQNLIHRGYKNCSVADTPGTFTSKGEIFDLYPVGGFPVRLHYFDEMIEEIFPIDPLTQRTDRNHPLQKVWVFPSPHILSHSTFVRALRNNIPMPTTKEKYRFEKRKQIFEKLSQGEFFLDYPKYLPLFFEKNQSLLDYLQNKKMLIHFVQEDGYLEQITDNYESLCFDFTEQSLEIDGDTILPSPEKLYFTIEQINLTPHPSIFWKTHQPIEETDIHLLQIEKSLPFILRQTLFAPEKHNKFEQLAQIMEFLGSHSYLWKQILFTYIHEESQKEFRYLLETHLPDSNLVNKIQFIKFPLDEGFYDHVSHSLILAEKDIFAHKTATHKKRSKSWDLFAEQLATLKINDYVIHSDYGIGRYAGMQQLEIGGHKSDFLILIYEDNDKVYVPIYKLNLIQKYSDGDQHITVANLKTKKFESAKQRVRKSVQKLAFDLIELEAKRAMAKSFAFSPPDHLYNEFELTFPFETTNDQKSAIDDILNDMQLEKPMDRLVCGDVGFGKTEVGMRAAFKAVLDKKQVAVLVPTTILALQHYNSFKDRFKDFPVNIAYLSRTKGPKESKHIMEEVKKGAIDIIIGTHRLLSNDVSFHDLGLLIIDEEQRFGVGHKEKLKLLRHSVDCLTLTATPIPRTLQLSFLGIKTLSLIQAPPPRRQAIQTYLIQQDDYTIKKAIEKEIQRNGQIFYVHNRIDDIEIIVSNIKSLVPEAKVTWAHGQLDGKELEERMQSFYDRRYNVLIATTIIESGLDVPSANTLLIHDAHKYGLSQLHQLRGRIGRSDRKAYAYFMVPKERNLSSVAQRRLEALQTYADLGAGFSIASCDLEIRGAGDILGAEQSGHIESVGLELYMQLIKDAIAELKGQEPDRTHKVEMQVPFSFSIPDSYIADSAERLRFYKKLSNTTSHTDLDQLIAELSDIYGELPSLASNLCTLLKARIEFQVLPILAITVKENQLILKFDQDYLITHGIFRDKMVDFFLKHPRKYRFRQDGGVTYTHTKIFDAGELLAVAKGLIENLTKK